MGLTPKHQNDILTFNFVSIDVLGFIQNPVLCCYIDVIMRFTFVEELYMDIRTQ
jgi:hypothetical protein